MKTLLVLARGDGRNLVDLDGRSIFDDLPFPVVVMADKASDDLLSELGPTVIYEKVTWSRVDAIRARAAALHAERGLLGIAVLDEKMVEFAAELRTELGLPGMDHAHSLRFRDKLLMKKLLGEAGVRVPGHARCDRRADVEQLLAMYQRLVIKPVDGLGARNVAFIDTQQELDAWYEEQRDPQGYEAEEFIDGVLHHVNALVQDGHARLTASAIYLPSMGNIDFPAGAPFVSVMVPHGELEERLQAFSDRVIAVLGLRDGITHLECFVCHDGEIVFCEIAARPGGGGIVLMIEQQFGVNFCRALLLLEAGDGDRIRLPGETMESVAGLIGFRLAGMGTVKRIASVESFRDPWVSHADIYRARGDFVTAAGHCTDYVGLFVFSSASRDEFETRRIELYKRFFAEFETDPPQPSLRVQHAF
jgi:biotin carboxylase